MIGITDPNVVEIIPDTGSTESRLHGSYSEGDAEVLTHVIKSLAMTSPGLRTHSIPFPQGGKCFDSSLASYCFLCTGPIVALPPTLERTRVGLLKNTGHRESLPACRFTSYG